MAEQIEQLMRQVKLGGMAKGWRSVPYENTEQYAVSYTHLTLRRYAVCRSRWSPYH